MSDLHGLPSGDAPPPRGLGRAGLITAGLAGESDTVHILSGNVVQNGSGHWIYTAPSAGASNSFSFDVTDQYGDISAAATVTAALEVQTSPDGSTWTTVQTLPSASYATGVWTYFDLNPSITTQFVKIVLPGTPSWTLNQVQLGLANGQDILLGGINVDDYYNLPDKQMQGQQPNTQWIDRQLDTPIIKVWPTANPQAFYAGTVTARLRR